MADIDDTAAIDAAEQHERQSRVRAALAGLNAVDVLTALREAGHTTVDNLTAAGIIDHANAWTDGDGDLVNGPPRGREGDLFEVRGS